MKPFAGNTESAGIEGLKFFVMAFNRHKSLDRLLKSLIAALDGYRLPAHLVISLDHGYDEQVKSLAESVTWPYGEVDIRSYEKHLGLNGHVFHLFDSASKESDSLRIVFLEDDTLVLNNLVPLLEFETQHFNNRPEIFGASFYSYYRNEEMGIPFIPLQTGLPLYALQKVSSRGWITSPEKLCEFILWKSTANPDFTRLPRYMQVWEKDAWEKWVNAWLTEQHKYLWYPYYSATVGFGEEGRHHKGSLHRFLPQTPVHRITDQPFANFSVDQEPVAYDAFYEISAGFLQRETAGSVDWPDSFDVDLYGSKYPSVIGSDHVLTSRFRKKAPYEVSFGMDLMPVEQNILLNNPGNEIRLIRKKDFAPASWSALYLQLFGFRLHAHIYQTLWEGIKMKVARMLARI